MASNEPKMCTDPLDTFQCTKHGNGTGKKKRKIVERTVTQMRLGFCVGDKVRHSDKYIRVQHPTEDMGVGVIEGLQDRYSWEHYNSTACIEFPCGCRKLLDVSWLTKVI